MPREGSKKAPVPSLGDMWLRRNLAELASRPLSLVAIGENVKVTSREAVAPQILELAQKEEGFRLACHNELRALMGTDYPVEGPFVGDVLSRSAWTLLGDTNERGVHLAAHGKDLDVFGGITGVYEKHEDTTHPRWAIFVRDGFIPPAEHSEKAETASPA